MKSKLKESNTKQNPSPIDKVTVTNLYTAIRMAGYQLDETLIGKIIDLVELLEEKGDAVSIADIIELKKVWDA